MGDGMAGDSQQPTSGKQGRQLCCCSSITGASGFFSGGKPQPSRRLWDMGRLMNLGAHWARKELGRAFALASEGVLAHLVPLWSISSPRRGPSWSQHPSGRLRHGSIALSLQGRKSQEDLGRQPPSCSSARVLGDVLSASGATTLVGRCWLSREGGGFRSSGRS